MKNLVNNFTFILLFALSIVSVNSCTIRLETRDDENEIISENDKLFISTMEKHLAAVSNKDISSLKSTLSPLGNMQLILPNTEITNTVEEFIKFHEWTFETKIVNTEIGEDIGLAVTEIIYKEPERNGKPYFNRMHVSYGLKIINGIWYVITDHASSVEKSNMDK